MHFLSFEKSIAEIFAKIEKLKDNKELQQEKRAQEAKRLEIKLESKINNLYNDLPPWHKTLVARHPDRPHSIDYIAEIFDEYETLCGDRLSKNDEAIIGGIGTINDINILFIAHEKGKCLDSRIKHNFGMASPEGYRKAIRLIKLANKFNLPIVTFVDTAGAYPGIEAEQRGQAEAIARSIQACINATVPIITFIIGEGGSGGAIAIATANHVVMLEHSIYSVISPEGCASILWRSNKHVINATKALKLTAQDLYNLQVIDEIIDEQPGAAHLNKIVIMNRVKESIIRNIKHYKKLKADELKEHRMEKFMNIDKKFMLSAESITK